MLLFVLAALAAMAVAAVAALSPADYEITSLPGLTQPLPFRHYAGYMEATVWLGYMCLPPPFSL